MATPAEGVVASRRHASVVRALNEGGLIYENCRKRGGTGDLLRFPAREAEPTKSFQWTQTFTFPRRVILLAADQGVDLGGG